MVERLLHWFAAVHDVRSVALRYFNAAGATEHCGEDHHPETHLIPLAIDTARGRRESLSIFGSDYPTPDGTCLRDYVHVVDLARAHHRAARLLMDGATGATSLNLGGGGGASVLEVIRAVEEVGGRRLATVLAPRRSGDPPALVADWRRARQVLDWQPERSALRDIVGSAWNWRERFPDGYRNGAGG